MPNLKVDSNIRATVLGSKSVADNAKTTQFPPKTAA
jgi:hypothetical protein